MKKYIKIGIGFLLVSIIVFLGFTIGKKLNHKKEVAERIQTIPEFSFTTIDGVSFTQNNITKTQPKLFIYFNSECDFCHGEAKQIQENIDNLKNFQLVFISFEASNDIATFAKKYDFNTRDNIVFLEDEKMLFAQLFDAKTIPFMALYSKDNKLIKQFKGATKIENILKHL